MLMASTSRLALILLKLADRPESMTSKAVWVAPAEAFISPRVARNLSPPSAVRARTPCPASMLPNMSSTEMPASSAPSFMVIMAEAKLPSSSKNCWRPMPVRSRKATSALVPSLPSSAMAAFIWVAATAVGVPEAVRLAMLAVRSLNGMPTAEAMGAIWKMEALISSNVVFPSLTAVNIRSLASVAPMTSAP